MASQRTSTPHLDGYLKGIRDEFDRLNDELEETRKQRDEFIAKYTSQVKELQELRQTISSRENHTVYQHGHTAHTVHACGDNTSLAYHFDGEYSASTKAKEIGHLEGEENQEGGQNEINAARTITETTLQAIVNQPENSGWDVFQFNGNTKAALNLNLVHKLTQEGRTRVAFSMDGKYLAAASSSGIVSIFDLKSGKKIMHKVTKDPYQVEKSLHSYRCLAFSPDSKYLATGEEDGNVQIWIVSQRRVRNTFRHQDAVITLNFSPHGRYIVTCSYDLTVKVWRLRDGHSRVLTASDFEPWSVRFSPDGRYISSGGVHGKMLIWNVRTEKLVARWRGHSSLVTSLVFTPDGKSLLSGSWDMQVIQWDVSSLSFLGIRMANPLISDMIETSCLIGHGDVITTVSISHDGKWIASSSLDRTVRVWNAHDATLHCILHCLGIGVASSVEFSPVGNWLGIGGGFGVVEIWNYVNP